MPATLSKKKHSSNLWTAFSITTSRLLTATIPKEHYSDLVQATDLSSQICRRFQFSTVNDETILGVMSLTSQKRKSQ